MWARSCALQAAFTSEDGGILDDLMVTNRGDHLFLVVNAACKAQDQRLERGRRARALEPDLAHVRDVEEPGRGARMVVLGQDPGGVLHRHVVAGEWHHLRAKLAVQRVQRGDVEPVLRGVGHGRSSGHRTERPPAHRGRSGSAPPLSLDLKDSRRRLGGVHHLHLR